MSKNYKKLPFPNPLAPAEEKNTEEFGKQVFSAIMGDFEDYRGRRNSKYFTWRKFAEGEQDIQEYLDLTTRDGKTLYQNISYKPRPIAKKFEEIIVNGYLMRKELPRTTALSKRIKDRKEKKKSDARFRMEQKDLIKALSQETGFEVEDPSAFVPESLEELDIHSSLNDKEKEELLMQEMVKFALEDNNIKALKKKFLKNMYQTNLGGLYNYIDRNGRLIIEEIDSEDCIYSSSRKEDFSDIYYAGRFMRMTISDLRSRFSIPKDKEEQLYKCAIKYKGRLGNPSALHDWIPDYRNASTRPYDSWVVEVGHIWWKCSKVIGYTEGKDRYGRTVFDTHNRLPVSVRRSDGRKKDGGVYAQTAYEGYFVRDGGVVLEWGEQKNILREGYDKEQVMCPFLFFMTGNAGNMLVPSMVDRITDSITVMDIAILKIKQTMAKHPPEGYAIDIDSLLGVDLGNGELEPLELVDIFSQTGNLFYRSKRDEDDANSRPHDTPIKPNFAPLGDRLNAFMAQYNAELANIRDYLGTNEFTDGSASNARIGFRFAEAQRQASNTATWGIYDAWLQTGSRLIKQIGTRIWNALNYGEVNKGYLAYLGKENVEFIQNRKDLTSTSYDFKFDMGLDEGQRQALQARLDASVSAGQLHPSDAIRIQNAAEEDVIVAEKLAIYLYDKRRKEAMEQAQQNAEMSADANARAGVAVESAKRETINAQMLAEQAKEKQRKDDDRKAQFEELGMNLILESFKEGKPIPPEYQGIVDIILQNRVLNIQADTQDKAQEEQAKQQQQALEQAVQNGEISPEDAQQIMGE